MQYLNQMKLIKPTMRTLNMTNINQSQKTLHLMMQMLSISDQLSPATASTTTMRISLRYPITVHLNKLETTTMHKLETIQILPTIKQSTYNQISNLTLQTHRTLKMLSLTAARLIFVLDLIKLRHRHARVTLKNTQTVHQMLTVTTVFQKIPSRAMNLT